MPVLGSTGVVTASSSTVGGVKPLPGIPVASNCYYNGGPSAGIPTTSATAATTSRSKHRATADCADLVLCYGNLITSTPPEVDGVNTYTVRAAIEWNGIILPVTFDGQRSGTCDPGGLLMSDPAPVEFFKGTDFWVRTYVSGGGTGIVTANRVAYANAGEGATAGSDLTATGSTTIADTTVGCYLYTPAAILGTATDPTVPTVAIIGDSIAVGSGDSASFGEVYSGGVAGGFIVRALNRNFGYVHLGQGSETGQQWLGHHRRVAVASTCKHWILQYGHNDFAAGRVAALVEADLITMARQGKIRGVSKVWITTQTPAASSTDSFATTTNQTISGMNPDLQLVNAWLRDGCPINPATYAPLATGTSSGVIRAGGAGHPVAGIFDTGATVESGPASGKWLTNGTTGYTTTDGTHPSATGHALMAAAINTALLT